jgi:hypothetical protein
MRKLFIIDSSTVCPLKDQELDNWLSGKPYSISPPEVKMPVIDRINLRRLSTGAKIALYCLHECCKSIDKQRVSSIIMASGLGALVDTQTFLTSISRSNNSLISPTPFIQGGHNTISGIVAQWLQNDGYNMTHLQQGLSFEFALIDASISLNTDDEIALVGSVDEDIPILSEIAKEYGWSEKMAGQITFHASAYALTPSASVNNNVRIDDVDVYQNMPVEQAIELFLIRNGCSTSVLSQIIIRNPLKRNLSISGMEIDPVVGLSFSSGALGLHFAHRYHKIFPKSRVLNVNLDVDGVGLILTSSHGF